MSIELEAAGGLQATAVADAMHPGVLTCPPEAPLRDVARMMARYRIHCVVVFTEDSDAEGAVGVWGVVSDADLAEAVARGDVEGRTAGGSARTPLVTVSPEAPLAEAARLMRERHVTHVVVVSPGTERPVGIVSTLDLARVVALEPGG